MKKAEDFGVEYRIWPLLDVENGYWLNRWNVGYYQETALNIILKLRENGLHPSWISLDMEPPPAIIQGLVQNLKKLKIKKAVRTLGKTCDPRAHTESIQEFRKLFESLKASGLLVHAVTTPFILNDYETGKPQVQTVLGVPLSCCAFDEVSFMAYRSEYENVMGRMNSKLVYDSARLAKKHFGDRAAIDLGVLGNIEFPNVVHGIQGQKGLLKDVNAAMKGGISKIHFYSLEGWLSILQENKLDSAVDWFNELDPHARKLRSNIRSSNGRHRK